MCVAREAQLRGVRFRLRPPQGANRVNLAGIKSPIKGQVNFVAYVKVACLRGGFGNEAYLRPVLVFSVRKGTSLIDEALLLMEAVQAFQQVGANDGEGVILCIRLLKSKLPFRVRGDQRLPIGVQRG